MTSAHQASLAEITAHLGTLSSTHSLETSLRTLKAAQTARNLSDRLMRVIAKVSSVGVNRNTSIRQEEEALRVALESMKREVEARREKAGELWSGVGALKARRGEGERVEWAVANEEGLRQILEVSQLAVVSQPNRLYIDAIKPLDRFSRHSRQVWIT